MTLKTLAAAAAVSLAAATAGAATLDTVTVDTATGYFDIADGTTVTFSDATDPNLLAIDFAWPSGVGVAPATLIFANFDIDATTDEITGGTLLVDGTSDLGPVLDARFDGTLLEVLFGSDAGALAGDFGHFAVLTVSGISGIDLGSGGDQTGFGTGRINPAVVPLPAGLPLLLTGLAAVAYVARRRAA